MPASTLTLTYGGPEALQPLDVLTLEQEPWSVYTGAITKGEMVRYLAALAAGDDYQMQIDCGLAGDQLVCTIYAYPLVPALNYRMYASWGTLSERAAEMLDSSELIQFRLTTSEQTKHPVRSLLAVDWEGECYGPEGDIVPPPALTSSGSTVECAQPVYGTAQVRYRCERHTYVFNAPRRGTALENNFSAVVAGVYEGGVTVLTVNPPPGIEAFEDDPEARCGMGWMGSGQVIGPDDNRPVEADKANRETVVDYCKQTIISDSFA